MAGIIESVSLYGGVCLTSGGIAFLISQIYEFNPIAWFPAGFSLPIGPLYLYLSSDHVLEKRLARWKKWRESGLIAAREYEELRKNATTWYMIRHGFKKSSPEKDLEKDKDDNSQS